MRVSRKGQVEFIAIFAVIIIAVIVIALSLNTADIPSSVPSSVAQEFKTVSDAVVGIGHDAASDALRTLEVHGGRLTLDYTDNGEPAPFAIYLNEGIPLWQACDDNLAPSSLNEMEFLLERAVAIQMTDQLESVEQALGSRIRFDRDNIDVNALINDKKIDFSVSVPTTIGTYTHTQPFTFSLPSDLKRIFSFAQDFAQHQSQSRDLDKFTIASLYLSNDADDGQPRVPTYGVLTSCGEVLYRSPQTLTENIEKSVQYTTAHTLWWRDIPVSQTDAKSYAISFSGNQYTDLKPQISLPDDFSIPMRQSILFINSKRDIRPSLTFPIQIPVCTLVYNQQYTFGYPYIITVKDGLSGNDFNFAGYVYIGDENQEGMQPLSCDTIPGSGAQCQDLSCSGGLTVQDSSHNPVENADVSFGGCYIGRTNSEGKLDKNIPCGKGSLSILKTGFAPLVQETGSESFSGTYTLLKSPPVKAHIRAVIQTPKTDYTECKIVNAARSNEYTTLTFVPAQGDSFTLSNIDPEYEFPDLSECDTDPAKCATFKTLETIDLRHFSEGSYTVTGSITDPNAFPTAPTTFGFTGAFIDSYTHPSESKEIYINIPGGFVKPGMTEAEATSKTSLQKSSCDISTIKEDTNYPTFTYKFSSACTCEKLRDIAVELRDIEGCFGANVDTLFTGSGPTTSCTKQTAIETIQSECDARIVGVCS